MTEYNDYPENNAEECECQGNDSDCENCTDGWIDENETHMKQIEKKAEMFNDKF